MTDSRNHSALNELLTLMARLREPIYGCPWDQVQTYQSIASSTLEEAYEVVDAIEQGDKLQLKEELGDLLFQVVFYSQLAKEEQAFTFDEIVTDLSAKLIRRHPHVFPDGTLASRVPSLDSRSVLPAEHQAAERAIKQEWEKTKQRERDAKGYTSVLDDVPLALASVVRATKLQKRAASVGFDWSTIESVYDKLMEEVNELKVATQSGDTAAIQDELGDVMFTVVNLARHLKVDAETACRQSSRKFEDRFRLVESQAQAECIDLALLDEVELDRRWQMAKVQLLAKGNKK
ncbi:MAG: ATP diphosphatase [Candidatus Endobugula sp.]|jgi:ATP diphosphatase